MNADKPLTLAERIGVAVRRTIREWNGEEPGYPAPPGEATFDDRESLDLWEVAEVAILAELDRIAERRAAAAESDPERMVGG
jgi:hypothetical protein